MDFFDLHHYPGNGVDDDHIWENFDIAGFVEKPLVLGEFGGIKPWWTDAARAAAAIMGLEVGSCRVGFDGWLVWAWRGDNATDIWWASDGDAEIARVVSPAERPDPCEYSSFDFIRYNHAPSAAVTASSEHASWPIAYANDQTPAYWNADGLPPQWIELTLPGRSRPSASSSPKIRPARASTSCGCSGREASWSAWRSSREPRSQATSSSTDRTAASPTWRWCGS
jgi:hypothetical protein